MTFKPYEGKEDDLQATCAYYLNLHPKAFFCHVPNGGNRNPREGAKFKRMGVRAGMPDLLIFNATAINDVYYRGLAIELKVKGGKLRENQVNALEELKRLGWYVAVCFSFDEFEAVVKYYFNE